VCAGIPCWGEDKRWDAKTAEVLRRMFPESTVTCVNDCVVGYAGALGLQPGINIVAGTGAIAYGENAAGCSARSNGWSSEFSDEGSCFWLGRQSLALFCKQADGRLPKMALYEIIRAHFAITDDFEIVRIYEKRYKGRRRETANLQRLLCQAAIHGDDSARLAYEQAARELAQSIEAVRLSLKMTGELSVSYSGGLFRTGALILDPLRQALDAAYESYRLQKPAYSPEAGALLLAAESVGCPLGAIKQTILGAEGSNDQQ
jgi:N-acetylglucosamine kinase-like BadF-type ATPase